MNCCSRSTLGLVIGILNILICIGIIIGSSIFLAGLGSVQAKDDEMQMGLDVGKGMLIILIVFAVIMSLPSCLLVAGIVKRRHRLMMPWIVLSGISFVSQCIKVLYQFFYGLSVAAAASVIMTNLFVGLISAGISGLVLWLIYTLYKDIRMEKGGLAGRC